MNGETAPMVWSAYLDWLDNDDVTELHDVCDVLPADLEG
jgi:hypothetical protein